MKITAFIGTIADMIGTPEGLQRLMQTYSFISNTPIKVLPSLGGCPPNYNLCPQGTLHHLDDDFMTPRFSVIMTANNADERYFDNAINSLRGQTFKDFELVVCCSSLSESIRLHRQLKNCDFNIQMLIVSGDNKRSIRFHEACCRALGEYLVVLDCDDYLGLNALKIVDLCLKRVPGLPVFVSGHYLVDVHNRQLGKMISEQHQLTCTGMIKHFQQQHLWGFHSNLVSKRRHYFESPYICEDFWFMAHCAVDSLDILVLPFCLYYYRQHCRQMTRCHEQEVTRMMDEIRIKLRFAAKQRGAGQTMGDAVQSARLAIKSELLKEVALELR